MYKRQVGTRVGTYLLLDHSLVELTRLLDRRKVIRTALINARLAELRITTLDNRACVPILTWSNIDCSLVVLSVVLLGDRHSVLVSTVGG